MQEVYHDASQPVTKICTTCHQNKPIDQFPFRNKRTGTYRAECKACKKAKDKARPKKPKPPKPPVQLTLQFTKVCRVCKEEKSLDQFIPGKECNFGVVATCRECTNKRIQRNRALREPLTHRVCTACHKDKPITEFSRDQSKTSGYREQCKECLKPKAKEYSRYHYINNLERYKERRIRDRDKNIQYARSYYLEHGDKHKAGKERWYRNNYLKCMEAGRRYSARKRNTATQKVSYKYILEQYGYWCHICDKIILPHHKLHFDHVIPLKRGGSHTEDNIKPAHGVCNTRKGIKLLEEMEVNQRRGPDDLLSDVTAQIMWLY